MTRFSVLLFTMFLSGIFFHTECFAQQEIKTIPGVFKGTVWDDDRKILQPSLDGQEVVFEQSLKYHILLIKEGKFISITPKWKGRLSPDHSLVYSNYPDNNYGISNASYQSFAPDAEPKHWGSVLSRITDDKPLKVFRDTNFIVGVNNENQLLVSTAFTHSCDRK